MLCRETTNMPSGEVSLQIELCCGFILPLDFGKYGKKIFFLISKI